MFRAANYNQRLQDAHINRGSRQGARPVRNAGNINRARMAVERGANRRRRGAGNQPEMGKSTAKNSDNTLTKLYFRTWPETTTFSTKNQPGAEGVCDGEWLDQCTGIVKNLGKVQ